MKKIIKTLIILFPLLAGCSNTPSAKEPSFADVGRQVTYDTFVSRYKQLVESINKRYFNKTDDYYGYTTFASNTVFKVKSYTYGRQPIEQKKDVLESHTQEEAFYHVDPVQNNVYSKDLIKKYIYNPSNTTVDLLGGEIKPGEQSSALVSEVYAENVNGTTYIANMLNRTYQVSTRFGDISSFMFNNYSMLLVLKAALNIRLSNPENYTYYINGNVLTYILNNSEVASYMNKNTVQLSFDDKLTIKGSSKIISGGVVTNITYLNLEMYKTTDSVEKINLDSYTIEQ